MPDFLRHAADQITAIVVSVLAILAPLAWLINIVISYRNYREQVRRTEYTKNIRDLIEERM